MLKVMKFSSYFFTGKGLTQNRSYLGLGNYVFVAPN